MKQRHMHKYRYLHAVELACFCCVQKFYTAKRNHTQDACTPVQVIYNKCRAQVRFFFRLILNTSRENPSSMLR